EAYGVEYLSEKVDAAHRQGLPPAWIKQGDLEKLDFPDESFDFALLNEVLEHVPDEAQALLEIRRVLRPGGILLILSPNRLYPFETHGLTFRRSGRQLPPYVPFIPYLPLRVGKLVFKYWARNYWPGELAALTSKAGFELLETDFIWQTVENISGQQPRAIGALRPLLRAIARTAERTPGIRRLGVSQAIVAIKPQSVRK